MLGTPHERSPSRSSRISRVFGLAMVATLAGACNLLNGSADLVTGVGPGGVGVPGDGGSGADGSGISRDGATEDVDGGGGPSDAGPDFVPDSGIDPTLASCGTNLVCLPDVDGWTPALYVPTFGGPKGGCPATYPVANTTEESGGGGCACVCSANNGSCAGSISTRSGMACGGAPTDLKVASGQCNAVAATLPLPVAFVAHPSGTPPTACEAKVTPELNPPRAATYCTGAVTSAGMCAAGEVCVTKPSVFNGGIACIVHDGDIACPPKMAIRMRYGATITDGRSCGTTCSCAPAACAGTVEAFSDGACSTLVRTAPADGSCVMTGAAMTGASYTYTPSNGCGVTTAAQVLGSETYAGTKTLCCGIAF